MTAAEYAKTIVDPTVKEALARDRRSVYLAAIVTYHLADYLALDIVAKTTDIEELDDHALDRQSEWLLRPSARACARARTRLRSPTPHERMAGTVTADTPPR